MDHLCGECLRQPGPIDKARAAAIHTGPLPAVIHSLKYRRRLQLARPLGRLLAAAFAHHWQPGEIDAVLPVPLHPRRMRQRGFNQTYLLLRRGWKNGGALPPVARGLLQRWRATPPQTGLERAARLENTRGAFRVPLPQTVAGRSLLLVDDVRTTGATAAACAGALLAAGARRVDLLTLSRVER
jgi:ComF family protein